MKGAIIKISIDKTKGGAVELEASESADLFEKIPEKVKSGNISAKINSREDAYNLSHLIRLIGQNFEK